MSKLFEFAVIYTPVANKEQRENGIRPKPELLVDVTRVLADNEQQAAMLAARAIPAEYTDRLAQVEVAIRPF